jgi:hypothetical protein
MAPDEIHLEDIFDLGFLCHSSKLNSISLEFMEIISNSIDSKYLLFRSILYLRSPKEPTFEEE